MIMIIFFICCKGSLEAVIILLGQIIPGTILSYLEKKKSC